jgi:hypothetical protein
MATLPSQQMKNLALSEKDKSLRIEAACERDMEKMWIEQGRKEEARKLIKQRERAEQLLEIRR